jgi:hypothetical protein
VVVWSGDVVMWCVVCGVWWCEVKKLTSTHMRSPFRNSV